MKDHYKKRRGISLIEVVLVLAIIGIVINLVYSIYHVGSNSFAVSSNKGFSQQGVRNASLFLEDEFRYINGFIEDQQVENGYLSSSFYGLRKENDYLVVDKYEHVSMTEPMYSSAEIRRMQGNWEDIIFRHDDARFLDVFLRKLESSGSLTSSYDLDLKIDLLNFDKESPATNLMWDLSLEDTVMYYTKSIDKISGKISLNEAESIPEEPGGGGEVGQITINDVSVYDNEGNSVNESGINTYNIERKTNYRVEIDYNYTGSYLLTINVDEASISPNGSTIVITEKAPSAAGKSNSHNISFTENGVEKLDFGITIISVN